MNKGDSGNEGMPRSNSMLDLESGGGILTDDDEFRGYGGGNKRYPKRKLDRLRSGSLGNRLGNISSSRLGLSSNESDCGDENNDKEKSSSSSRRLGMGKEPKRPPKPPRPPRGPALDAADMKYIREISELSKVKHARIERMKSLRSKRVDSNKKSRSSSSLGANILAMVVTVVFFVIIVSQGLHSR